MLPPFFGGQPNPFSVNTMVFHIDAVHNDTGLKKELVMSMNVPHTATEHQARRLILDMAYSYGFRMLKLERLDHDEMLQPDEE